MLSEPPETAIASGWSAGTQACRIAAETVLSGRLLAADAFMFGSGFIGAICGYIFITCHDLR